MLGPLSWLGRVPWDRGSLIRHRSRCLTVAHGAALTREPTPLNALPTGTWRVFTLDGSRADWWRPVSTLYV